MNHGETKKKYLWGAKAIADRFCDGNERRARWLIDKGLIPTRKVGQLIVGEAKAIEEALDPR